MVPHLVAGCPFPPLFTGHHEAPRLLHEGVRYGGLFMRGGGVPAGPGECASVLDLLERRFD